MLSTNTMKRQEPAQRWKLLAVLSAWLLPQMAAATHVDDTWKYQVMLNGSNTIRISAPVYDMDGADCWVDNGNLKVTWTDSLGSHTETCFHWQRNGDSDNDNKDIYIHFRTDVGGSIDVTQGNSSNHFTLTKADGDIERLVYRNNDGKTFSVYAVWRVPYELLGKQLTFKWDVHRDGNSRDAMNVEGLDDVPITMPAAQEVVLPQVTMATLSYSEIGKLELPWFIASTKLTAARYEYTDQSGNTVSQDMPTDANSGIIYLDATVPHDNFRVVVSYLDKDDNPIENVSSPVQDLPVIHAPAGLAAIPTGNRKAAVRLTWSIPYPGTDDLTATDFFEVQRSLTGDEKDFVTIASVPFMTDSDNHIFEYTDSTLIDAISAELLTGGGTLDGLTYRVRRMITQNWGWDGNSCAQSASCVVADIHLLRIASYDARWEDERAFTVRVTWDYADELGAVWDSRARMKLSILMKNRAGEVVDSMRYELTDNERQQRYKVVTLARPCVGYDIKVYVEQGTSPIGFFEQLEKHFFPIRNNSDWDTFCQMVQAAGGQHDVNARLYADISIERGAGGSTCPFRGIFDGNGHTLDMKISTVRGLYEAPFIMAKDYTILNLRTAGSVTCEDFTSGLVGYSDASAGRHNAIRNCRVSASVRSTMGYVGGFIGNANKAGHDISDCLFDGTLIVTNADSYPLQFGGAIICWGDEATGNVITNCLENGSYMGFVNSPVGGTNLCFADYKGYNNGGNNTNNWSTHGWGYDARGMSDDQLLAALGSGWIKEGDSVVPLRASFAAPVDSFATPTLPDFHHESIGKIDQTLMTETRQSSVLLVWETDGNPIDYFTVLRRLQGEDDTKWSVVATDIDQLSYEDKSVSPLEDYEYKVRATNDCEGQSYTETQPAAGACKHTGLLEGYVRFNDGTGVPDITVEVAPQDGGTAVSVKTDQSGYYKAEDLSYMGRQSVTYVVTPVSTGGIRLENEQYAVTFDNTSNRETVHEFTVNNGLGFSAYVMYDGTSIPVKGARFMVNGQLMHNAAGKPVETDFEGRAEFQVLGGVRQTIQVVMQGHNFVDNGYYKSQDGVVLTDRVAQIYFYDATLVKLTGRVVGGNDQGSLPLDNNLSRNNLGDDLTMVLTLEGDNTSWLVYDNQNPTMSERQLTFSHPGGWGHKTVADVQRKRMVVHPDSLTGEYVLMLPPVRWKVQQVYCEGYPTLFQDGQVSEIVDLTECLTPDTIKHEGTFVSADEATVYQPTEIYNAKYNRIYHAPVEIAYRQIGYDTFDYFGDKSYVATTVGGERVSVPLAFQGSLAGYEDNPYDKFTHRPTLTPDGTSPSDPYYICGDNTYDHLFDGNPATIWQANIKSSRPAYVQFKTNHPVSLKEYELTTAYNKNSAIWTPEKWKLMGKANETDEWVTIDDQSTRALPHNAAKAVSFPVSDQRFYQYFRLEIWDNGGGTYAQLADVQLICRGNSDNTPDDDRKTPIFAGSDTQYTFGYPVFSLERRYPIEIQVGECYYYNNDRTTGQVDVVAVGSGQVTVHNGMKNGLHQETVQLNNNGYGTFMLEADQTTRLLTGENALRTVTMTLTQDGTTYEAEPLRGYVLNMFATGGASDVLADGMPQLVDILRDPPGGNSYATLSKGSKLKYTYTLDMSLHAGLHLNIVTGSKLQNFQGAVITAVGNGSTAGIVNGSDNSEAIDFEYAFDMEGHRGFSYTINVGQDITTSSDPKMVGADADLYIGIVQNMIVTPMSTIRAIPDDLYQQMLGRLGDNQTAGISNQYGSLVHIAEGHDREGNKFHLVRDESIGYGPTVESQFVHSQKHILTELLPQKVKQLRELMFIGTAAEAQKQANATGKPVYRSLLNADDDRFGLANTKDGMFYYYTSTMPEEAGMNYVIHLPDGTTKLPDDEVAEICQVIYAWVQMIAQNEHEKLTATDHVANYDVDGGSSVSYGEQFESQYDITNYYHLPGIIAQGFFDEGGTNTALTLTSVFGVKVAQYILKIVYENYVNQTATTNGTGTAQGSDRHGGFETSVYFYGSTFKFSLMPVMDYSVKDVSGESKAFSRKENFTISMDKKSHLNFDLYRTQTDTDLVEADSQYNVFSNQNFNEMTDYVDEFLQRGSDLLNARYSRGFVYRTRGGATCNPWEDERKTLFYEAGRILDERTKKICNPKITLDKQSVSGVAIGDPARFKVYLTNESEQPEAATGALRFFTFYLDSKSNPDGAKIFVDGAPLTADGTSVLLEPGQVLEKTLEVYAGEEFDYEGLTIGIVSPNDIENTANSVSFDVHYLHEAGPVLIAQPGDKWVMNTNAQYDNRRGWFLPVTINGFNKHQHNFDHIEFQYKESMRGDDAWTNLCSYYADSLLMANASGVCEMIPENGNITTHFYGEGTVIEKPYDLRAVLYCRNGSSFLTKASPIVSGVKDTRRPQLFGTPEPKSGILGIGDNIVFNFTEDIEYNYLNAITNFEVRGEVNNDNVTENVSLLFTNKASVESEAQRNFSGKDVTIDLMIKPEKTGRDMPLFSHGTNNKELQLWLTAEGYLRAVIDGQTFTSDSLVADGGFTQVAMVISQAQVGQTTDDKDAQKPTLTFYNGGIEIGHFEMAEPYNGTGTLIFGRTNETDRDLSTYYEGRMMEARLWYRALTGGQIGTTYGSRRLTGYEMGLVDYYPMNEGSGDYAIDHTQGANARLNGASWAMPRGFSLHVDWDDKGIPLTQNALNRTSEQDYTLMFWFKTDAEGRGVLLANGAGLRSEINAQNQFCIAFEAEKLMYRSNGQAYELGNTFSDNKWHHYAMTVNRASNTANIYVDQVLRASFSPDSLGGISGGIPLIGAARYNQTQADGQVTTVDTRNWLRGRIDELCLFGQALPLTLLKSYSTKSPNGDEKGLLAYLSFDRQERQKDNDIELVAYPYSKKLYLDNNGNTRYELDPVTQEETQTPIRDYLFAADMADVLAHIDNTEAAPVVPYENLKNLNFSFAGKNNQVLVNINEQLSRINRRNIYVTLRDVEDKNGNAMASPATMCYYVSNSHLQWSQNRLAVVTPAGFENTVSLGVQNSSAKSHTFTIENCPKWLSLNVYSAVVGPQDMIEIKATINKSLNVGHYDEIVYLTDEDGISEPLYLDITVEADQPNWAWNVDSELLKYSMNIVGKVYVNGMMDIDTRDIVGVFDSENVCHGFAHVNYSQLTGENGVFLTVYDNKDSGRPLTFKLWQYSTGHELLLTAQPEVSFQKSAVIGTDEPVVLQGGSQFVQTIDLKKGWNWVSFNVANDEFFDMNKFLGRFPWQEGDVMTDMSSDLALVYFNGQWMSSDERSALRISPRKGYAFKVQNDISLPVYGSVIQQVDQRTITLRSGWNGMGYTPMLNLSVETALSDYYDKAEAGDVVKSHTEFAYFTITGGVGRWQGSLQYMKPGEGYMFLRKSGSETSFTYPFYDPGSTFVDEWIYPTARAAYAPQANRSTMSLSAVVRGFETEPGDRLVAYANGLECGSAQLGADSTAVSYLSIGGDREQGVWFAIVRGDDIVAATPELLTFRANDVVGSPDHPTAIDFSLADVQTARWYTLGGVMQPGKPAAKGVYIYNGKKIVIK